jgi:hypothetical protein
MKKIFNFIKNNWRAILLFLLNQTNNKMSAVTITNKDGKIFNINDYMSLAGTDYTSKAEATRLYRKNGKIKKRILNRTADREEVIDTGADTYQVLFIIVSALRDGFDLTDIIVAIGQESAIREIINDAPLFWQGLMDHKVLESEELVVDLLDEVESRVGEVKGIGVQIFNALWLAASTGEFIANVLSSAKAQVDLAKEVPGSTLLVPRKNAA